MRTKEKFPWRSFLKQLALIAIPVALQNLLTTTGTMVDTMMIAPLGELSVGAVGLCAQFSSLLFSGYWGFVGGGMLFFSQYWGAKDDDGIDRAYGMTLACMMTVAFTFAGFALFAPDLIMRLYTDKVALQEIGIQYLRTVGVAYIFQVFSMGMSAVLRSTERVRIPLYASIASVATNILLNWVFIYGKLGMPALGIRGAAMATVCAAIVNATVILILAKAQHFPYLFHFRKHFRWTKAHLAEYFKKCFPIICNEVLMGTGIMCINIVIGRQSEQAIAAIAVFRTLEGLAIGFFSGFSNAASVLVGTCVGAGQLKTAYERAKRLVYLCAASIFSVCLLLVIVRKPVLTAMSLSGESLAIGSGLLMIYCITAAIRMSNWVQNDTYRSAGDAVTGTVLEIAFMYIMVLPVVYLAGMVWKVPFLALFACTFIDEPIRFFLMQRHMYSGKWIRPVTPEGRQSLQSFAAALNRTDSPRHWRKRGKSA